MNSLLLGTWETDPDSSRAAHEKIIMEISDDGQLIYKVIGEGSEKWILLTYRVEGDIIITDQPSSPREERTQFSFTTTGKLLLIHGKEKFYYVRSKKK